MIGHKIILREKIITLLNLKKYFPLKLVKLPDWSWRKVKPNKLRSNR